MVTINGTNTVRSHNEEHPYHTNAGCVIAQHSHIDCSHISIFNCSFVDMPILDQCIVN